MAHVAETRDLPPISFDIPKTLNDCVRGGASALGMSATSSWLSCPQYSYLSSRGVRQKQSEYTDSKMSATAFGSLFHALRAARFVHGMPAAERMLRDFWQGGELSPDDAQRALLMLRVYDQAYEPAQEPFDVLGVEVTVISNIRDWWGRPLYRSVRYDTVVKMKSDGAVFSLECKTASRGGQSALNPYIPQGMSHSALWNANPHLVEKYGEMQGTIWDAVIKTVNPGVERVGPRYFTKKQQAKVLEYLRLPEVIQMPRLPDGNYPRFFHTCWGRWSPCPYIGLCHDDVYGDYEVDGENGEPVTLTEAAL